MDQGDNPEAGARPAEGRSAWRLERIGGWLAVAANFGVLAGLILVIVQLDQNQRMMRAQTRHEIAAGVVQLLADTAGNAQLSELVIRGSSGAAMTPAERFQFNLRIGALLRIWEDEHYQYRMGLYDEDEFARERRNWQAVLGEGGGVLRVWCQTSANYSAEFAKELNGLMDKGACVRPK